MTLRAVDSETVPLIFESYHALDGDRWSFFRRFGIRSVNLPHFLEFVATGSFAQALFVDDGTVIGLWSAFGLDERNRVCQISYDPIDLSDGYSFDTAGAYEFPRMLFNAYPLRHVYLEIPEVDLQCLPEPIREVAVEEVRMSSRWFRMGQYCDGLTLKLSRESVSSS